MSFIKTGKPTTNADADAFEAIKPTIQLIAEYEEMSEIIELNKENIKLMIENDEETKNEFEEILQAFEDEFKEIKDTNKTKIKMKALLNKLLN